MNELNYTRPLVLGGTGYIGSAIVTQLVKAGLKPILVVRDPAKLKFPKAIKSQLTLIQGDASRLDEVRELIAKAKPDSVIYAIGLLRESIFSSGRFLDYHHTWAKICIDMCKRWQVNRFIYISGYGVNQKSTSYQKTKLMAEQYLQNSGMLYTIVRPVYVLGAAKSYHFMNIVRNLLALKITPLVNGGNFLINLVNRQDLAQGVVASLNNNLANRKIFVAAGPDNLTFKDFVAMVAKHYHWGYLALSIPSLLIMPLARIFRKVPIFPVSDEQLKMLTVGIQIKPADSEFWHINNIVPKSLSATIKEYQFE